MDRQLRERRTGEAAAQRHVRGRFGYAGAGISIEVDDVDAAFDKAKAMGCDIVYPLTDEPWGVRRFYVRDPAGKVLNVLMHKDA